MKQVVSGFSKLDHFLGDGSPMTSEVIVSGNQRDIYRFAHQLLWTQLNEGDACFYATLSQTREEVINDLAEIGWNVAPFIRKGILRIVDYLSLANILPHTSDDKLKALYSIHQEDLITERFYQIFEREFQAFQNHHPDQRFLAILDSVDRMIAAMGVLDTLRFEQMTLDLLEQSDSMAIALVCNDFICNDLLDAIKTTAKVFIELKHEHNGPPMIHITKDISG